MVVAYVITSCASTRLVQDSVKLQIMVTTYNTMKTKGRPHVQRDGLLFCAVALCPYAAGGSATALGLPLLDMSTTSSFLKDGKGKMGRRAPRITTAIIRSTWLHVKLQIAYG